MRTAVILFALALAVSQGQQAARVEFEVASVTAGDPNDPSSGARGTPGGLEMRNATLSTLVLGAYRLNQFQLYGGPKWLNSARFNVKAKYPAGTTSEQEPLMMQNLLADRFKLVVHRETRMLQQYDLVVAKGGPKLEAASEDNPRNGGSSQGPRSIKAWGARCDALAGMLISYVGAPVRNKTGLEGKYNVDLSFAPMQGATAEDDARPSVFAAVQAIGLKLEATKAPVEVVVIDSAEMPSGN